MVSSSIITGSKAFSRIKGGRPNNAVMEQMLWQIGLIFRLYFLQWAAMLLNNSPTLVEHWVAHSCFFFCLFVFFFLIWMALAYKLTPLDETEPVLHSQGLAASYYTAGNLLLTESSMARDNCGLSKWSLWAPLKGEAHDVTTKESFTA